MVKEHELVHFSHGEESWEIPACEYMHGAEMNLVQVLAYFIPVIGDVRYIDCPLCKADWRYIEHSLGADVGPQRLLVISDTDMHQPDRMRFAWTTKL